MEDSILNRLICDQSTLMTFQTLATCKSCNRIDKTIATYNGPCHKGNYCFSCKIKFTCQCKQHETYSAELQNITKTLRAKCKYHALGCIDALPLDKLEDHEASCQIGKHNSFLPLKFGNSLNIPPFISKSYSTIPFHTSNFPPLFYSPSDSNQFNNVPFQDSSLQQSLHIIRVAYIRETN